jgi:hypothetical protein
MPTFRVQNRVTRIILGEVTVDEPSQVLDALADATGCSIDDIARSLGATLEEAAAALDIVEVRFSNPKPQAVKAPSRPLKPKGLYA